MASSSSLECTICMENYNDSSRRPKVLACGHSLCLPCLENCITRNMKKCSVCRISFTAKDSDDIPVNTDMEKLIQFVSQLSVNRIQTRKEILEEAQLNMDRVETSTSALEKIIGEKGKVIANKETQIQCLTKEIDDCNKEQKEMLKYIEKNKTMIAQMNDSFIHSESSDLKIKVEIMKEHLKHIEGTYDISSFAKTQLKVSTMQAISGTLPGSPDGPRQNGRSNAYQQRNARHSIDQNKQTAEADASFWPVSHNRTSNHNILQVVFVCTERDKDTKLIQLLSNMSQLQHQKILVFIETKMKVVATTLMLRKNGWPAMYIHEDQFQQEQDSMLKEFQFGQASIMLTTDVAVLGLEINGVKTVINYDYPNSSQDYVHRIGRTSRGKIKRIAYTFFTSNNGKQARNLINVLQKSNQYIEPDLFDLMVAN